MAKRGPQAGGSTPKRVPTASSIAPNGSARTISPHPLSMPKRDAQVLLLWVSALCAPACFHPVSPQQPDGGPAEVASFEAFCQASAAAACALAAACCREHAVDLTACEDTWQTLFLHGCDAGSSVFHPDRALDCLQSLRGSLQTCPATSEPLLSPDPSTRRSCWRALTGSQGVGMACDALQDCSDGLICLSFNGAAAVCATYGWEAGDPCGEVGPRCDGAFLFCNADTGRCQPYLPPGQPCGALSGDACGPDAFCGSGGACQPRIPVGASCAGGEPCEYGSQCANGTCVASEPAGAACASDLECASSGCLDGGVCESPNAYCLWP